MCYFIISYSYYSCPCPVSRQVVCVKQTVHCFGNHLCTCGVSTPIALRAGRGFEVSFPLLALPDQVISQSRGWSWDKDHLSCNCSSWKFTGSHYHKETNSSWIGKFFCEIASPYRSGRDFFVVISEFHWICYSFCDISETVIVTLHEICLVNVLML